MSKNIFFVLAFFFLLSPQNEVKAQNYQLHAVFINSFIKYVKWPDEHSSGDFKIGIVGDSPIVDHLKKLADVKKINGRNIVVETYPSAEQAKNVHILYLPESQAVNLPKVLGKFGTSPTMVITEKDGLGSQGSNINFIIRNGRLAFELNLAAMEKSNLKVSQELTRLAIEI
ncbi:MAG: YfiR family protein [Candidatus Cyclobacteriaceae bacterium M2_1C_046]